MADAFLASPPDGFDIPLPPLQEETPGPVAQLPDGTLSAWPPQNALYPSEGLPHSPSEFAEMAPATSPERAVAVARTCSHEKDAMATGLTAAKRVELKRRMADVHTDALLFMHRNGLDPAQCLRPSRDYVKVQLALLQRSMVMWAKAADVDDKLGFDPEGNLAGLVETAMQYRVAVGSEEGTTAHVETEDGSPVNMERFMTLRAGHGTACKRCRLRRRGCTHEFPCTNCVKAGHPDCVYLVKKNTS